MYAQVEKSKENKSSAVANSVTQKKSSREQGLGIVDNRSESKIYGVLKKTPKVYKSACSYGKFTEIQQMKVKSNNKSAHSVLQMVQPPIPLVDTSTLKGKVLARALNHIPDQAHWSDEVQRWMFKCFHCKSWVTEEAVQADHYPISQALGGRDDLDNLVLSCGPCNAANIHNSRQMVTRGAVRLVGEQRKYIDHINESVNTSTLKGKVLYRALNHIPDQADWSDEVQRWMFKCFHCKSWVTEEAVQADHYPISQALGGRDDLDNLVLSCGPCNAANIHNSRQMVTRGAVRLVGEQRKYTE